MISGPWTSLSIRAIYPRTDEPLRKESEDMRIALTKDVKSRLQRELKKAQRLNNLRLYEMGNLY